MTVGPGREQARRDHLGHIRRVTEGRPCVTLKLAETADGFASGGRHDPRLKITGPIANARVQTMRATHEAIMVGVETALADDPALTVRLPGLDRKPLAGRPRHASASSAPLSACGRRARPADTRFRGGRRPGGGRGARSPAAA